MKVALKEWAVVVEALAQGRQIFLLRKGGIAEGKRGFELKHREFLFYPTWEHQQEASIREEFHELFRQVEPAEDKKLLVRYGATVREVLPAPPIERLLALEAHHIWAEPYLRMRYDYRPDLPLYLVFVEPWELPATVEIPYDRRFAGCRSWVDLYEKVDDAQATFRQRGDAFKKQRQKVRELLQAH